MPLRHRPQNAVDPPAQATASRQPFLQRAGAALAIIALLIGGLGLAGRREGVVRAWPGSAGLFAAVGLPVNLRGLSLRAVQSQIIDDRGQRVLAVEGSVVNLRPHDAALPDLVLSVRAADGRTLYTWTSPAPKARIAAAETVLVGARLASPPAEGRDVRVQFASAAPATRLKTAAK